MPMPTTDAIAPPFERYQARLRLVAVPMDAGLYAGIAADLEEIRRLCVGSPGLMGYWAQMLVAHCEFIDLWWQTRRQPQLPAADLQRALTKAVAAAQVLQRYCGDRAATGQQQAPASVRKQGPADWRDWS